MVLPGSSHINVWAMERERERERESKKKNIYIYKSDQVIGRILLLNRFTIVIKDR